MLSTSRLALNLPRSRTQLHSLLKTTSMSTKPPLTNPRPPQTFISTHPKKLIVLTLTTLATAQAYSFVMDELGSLEGLKRTLSFYTLAIPSYIQYRYYQNFHNDLSVEHEADWDKLHQGTSIKGLDKILELRGFYIKTGQMAASNIGNAFPPIWQSTFSILQDGVPPKDFETVKHTIETDLNCKLEDIFSSFEPTAIGSASIGQVHRAVLKSTGQKVVVKVQYPEVERLFRGDVRTLIMFCKLAQPVHVPALEEIEKQFMTEFDYRKEGGQLDAVRANLIRGGYAGESPDDISKMCGIPKSFPEYTSKNVLVMEELKGRKLAEGLRVDAERYATRMGMSVDEFIEQQKKKQEELENSTDKSKDSKQTGPDKRTMDVYIAAMDAERRFKNLKGLTANLLINWWYPGRSYTKWEGKEILPINHAKMIDDLIEVHGHEIFIDGYFQGDPHPGNMLLMDQDKGKPRLGLIDYGQVKKLTWENRVLLSKFVIALYEDDKDAICDLLIQVGYKTKHMNRDWMYKYGKVTLDQDNKALTGGLHIQAFMEKMESIDPIVELPRDFVMVSRVSLMLRGIGHTLGQERELSKGWRKFALMVLEEDERIKAAEKGGGGDLKVRATLRTKAFEEKEVIRL